MKYKLSRNKICEYKKKKKRTINHKCKLFGKKNNLLPDILLPSMQLVYDLVII